MARARDLVHVYVDNLILIEEGAVTRAVKQVSFSMTILYIIYLLYVFVYYSCGVFQVAR